jgi:hypothetical protein
MDRRKASLALALAPLAARVRAQAPARRTARIAWISIEAP